MAILIDTQILIWLEENETNIPKLVLEEIATNPLVYFSKVSVWEMAIKVKTGKLSIKKRLEDFIDDLVKDYYFKFLDISLPHIYQTQQLDLHHRDPFDRLLAAQSIVENMPIISSDEIFDQYQVNRIWK